MGGITEEEFLELTNAHTPKTFSLAVEKMAIESEIGYLDAIIEYTNSNSIEMDIVPKLITKPLKEKLEVEAKKLNFLPGFVELPI